MQQEQNKITETGKQEKFTGVKGGRKGGREGGGGKNTSQDDEIEETYGVCSGNTCF